MRPPSLALASCLAALLVAGCASSPTTTPTPTPTPAPSPAAAPPEVRTYHLFTSTLDFNETALGLPHDIFFPAYLVANRGDTLHLQYHNTEDSDEHHTFTMGAPFNVDKDLAPGEAYNVTLNATEAGIFAYKCTIHQPSMTGYLVVL